MSDTTSIEQQREAGFGDYFALLKPRVMSLVVFTALVGLVVAPAPVHPFVALVAILCIAVGGGASGALNMWWEADLDALMRRTRGRPIPSGRVTRGEALSIGLTLAAFSVVMLALATNFVAAGLLAFTIFFYVVIYTMWLKRRTPLNIVIGGAAGAFPPMVGWAVATGGISTESLLMFALTFAWTPPHFWALSLFVKGDYGRAGIPMLPEVAGRRATRWHILGYSLVLAIVAIALGLSAIGGPVYMAVAVVMNALFLRGAWEITRRDDAASEADKHRAERALFRLSLLYILLLFGALMVEASLRPHGLGGWPI